MLHIGYVYEPNWCPKNATDYVPAFRPGARLVHQWIRFRNGFAGSVSPPPKVKLEYLRGDLPDDHIEAWTHSTLDLVPYNAYVLVHGNTAQADICARVAGRANSLGIPCAIAGVGRHFDFVDAKKGIDWCERYTLNNGSVVVVRPDQHVAGIAKSTANEATLIQMIIEG
jgi:hypothetical protein